MVLIARNSLRRIQHQITQIHYDDDRLFGGKLAAVWQMYYQSRAYRDDFYKARCLNCLSEVFDNFNNDTPKLNGASLSAGAAGFCYVVTMLHQERWLPLDLEQTLADLDNYLFESALLLIKNRQLDFWHGAFGILFYFLQRIDTVVIKEKASILVEKIIDEVQGSDNGLWFPNVNKPEDEYIINFSLSHGQTAFLSVLMQAAQKGIQTELITSVVYRGVNFVLKHHRLTDYEHNFSAFPLYINQDSKEPYYSNRLAVCNGDLNVVLLMYRAAEFLQDKNLRERADLVGLCTLQRQNEKATQVTDSHFCHGSAGVAQFYFTFYKITGYQAYYTGYQYWINKTIELLDKDFEKNTFKGEEGSLLNGYVGVMLVLLNYISEERLDWEKLFLL